MDAAGNCVLPSGNFLTRAIRKELRTLTPTERANLFNAFVQLKQRGEYDRLSAIHRDVGSHLSKF